MYTRQRWEENKPTVPLSNSYVSILSTAGLLNTQCASTLAAVCPTRGHDVRSAVGQQKAINCLPRALLLYATQSDVCTKIIWTSILRGPQEILCVCILYLQSLDISQSSYICHVFPYLFSLRLILMLQPFEVSCHTIRSVRKCTGPKVNVYTSFYRDHFLIRNLPSSYISLPHLDCSCHT